MNFLLKNNEINAQVLVEKTSKFISKTNKEMWKFIRSFWTNKGFLERNDITLKRKSWTDKTKLSDDFNDHYVKIVEDSCRFKANILGNKGLTDKEEIQSVIKS